MLSRIINQTNDPLYKNSLFIMLTSLSTAGFGFIFWIIAAKLYPKADIGEATALISSMSLLILLTRFGLDSSIIRFYPQNDRGSVFNTSIIITTLFTILVGLIFIAGIDIWSPELDVLSSLQNAVLYILFLVSSSIISLASASFNAMRRAELGFYQSVIVGSRVVVLLPLIFLGAMGIYGAVGVSFILACAFSLASLAGLGIRLASRFDRKFLNEAFHFSVGNYIVGLLVTAPTQIIPILVFNILGAEETAHYYIAYSIASLLFMVPTALGTSLFVEGSYGEGLKKSTLKSMRAIFLLLTPAAISLYLAGGWILGIIGKDYAASGLELLRTMAISSFFVAIFYIYSSIKKVQKDIKGLILLNGLIFVLLIGLGYIFMRWFGIVGMGYAYIVGYGIGALAVGAVAVKEKWI